VKIIVLIDLDILRLKLNVCVILSFARDTFQLYKRYITMYFEASVPTETSSLDVIKMYCEI
jgi:hypothetical protein